MYNNKTNSTRKESYKYNKPFNNKKRQNASHYQYNKYNKYKSRYSNSDSFSKVIQSVTVCCFLCR